MVNLKMETIKAGIVFYNDALEPSLEKMAAGVIFQIKLARVSGSKPLHGFGKIGINGL